VSLSPSGDRYFSLTHAVSLRLSGEYSDLTITCGPDTYKVHKAIVCSQSTFFSKAEKFPVCKVRQLANISARSDKVSCAFQIALLGEKLRMNHGYPWCQYARWLTGLDTGSYRGRNTFTRGRSASCEALGPVLLRERIRPAVS
jgi:hypothetical protein